MANSRELCLFLIELMIIIGPVKGRWLELSDGVHDYNNTYQRNVPFLSMGVSDLGPITMVYAEGKRCNSIYGFLPCADTAWESLFLIVMYTYALMLGEEWLHKGSAAWVMHNKGKTIAASLFHPLMALPRAIIVIVSGVSGTQSDAQNQVAFGVAMYAGSTLISLTGIWAVHVILKREKLHRRSQSKSFEDSSSNCFHLKEKLSCLTETGVNMNRDTRKMASIMLLSLVPFAFVLLLPLQVFSGPMMILVMLMVSGASLVCYITYLILKQWIKNKVAMYLKEEHFRLKVLKELQRLTDGRLYSRGQPNIVALRRLFSFRDLDESKALFSHDQLEELISRKLNAEKDEVSYLVEEIVSHFDTDDLTALTREEFEEGCTKWLEKWNAGRDGQFDSFNHWNKFVEEKGIEKHEKIERIMPRILFRLLRVNQKIVNTNGEIEQSQIDMLFRANDGDRSGQKTFDELEKAIATMHLGEQDPTAATTHVMDEFDSRHSDKISETEFIEGLKDWIRKAKEDDSDSSVVSTAIRNFAIDELDSGNTKDEPTLDILYVLVGILAIYLFARPFMQSVIQLSSTLHIPFLITSFVVAPFFMKARPMITFLLWPASRTRLNKNASLTFFELYGGLVMNNLLGLTTLLAVVYIRGLTWAYTAEVVIIIAVGAMQGFFALFRHTYPLWASVASLLLYVMTLILFSLYALGRA